MALIKLERIDDTAVIRFDRPPANAINLEFTEEFGTRLAEIESNLPAGGVVITSNVTTFCAGVDFKAAPNYTSADKQKMVGNISRIVTRLYSLPVATVAAVTGHAIGGGLVVAICCDYRIFASGDYMIGLTEVSAGIPYPAGPMQILKAELDPSIRRRLVLTGETISPELAQEYGIADEVVDPEVLLDSAVRKAQEYTALASFKLVKAQLKQDTIDRLRLIVENQDDPMIDHWI